MKFDASRNRGYLNFDDYVGRNAAQIDAEVAQKEIYGDWEWHEYAHKKYSELPDIDVAYDSTADTQAHIRRVSILINSFAAELLNRANKHDDSKLGSNEKPYFDSETPKLKALTYGTPEYINSIKLLGVALRHHYLHNSHHPEHYTIGIEGMDLLDLVEMFLDWKAASERHDDGNIYKSIEINRERFGISGQLCQILANTVDRLNFLYTPKPETELVK